MSDPFAKIRREWLILHHDRNSEIERVMAKYDETFRANVEALVKRCAVLGHREGKWHDGYLYCNACGGTIREESSAKAK